MLLTESSQIVGRRSFREPIPQIWDAARYLDAAVSAHLSNRSNIAAELIAVADMPVLHEWLESIWGKKSQYIHARALPDQPAYVEQAGKLSQRMPTAVEKMALIRRDGHHCRLCGIPVIRKEVRVRLGQLYSNVLQWGKTNATQHAAFQLMWLQYDHLIPHSRGGGNQSDNMLIVCAGCNFGRMSYTLEEVGFAPLANIPKVISLWDGLERIL